VRLRADWQALLTRTVDPLSMWLVLSESALRWQIGFLEVVSLGEWEPDIMVVDTGHTREDECIRCLEASRRL
jgi:hypothetical protein